MTRSHSPVRIGWAACAVAAIVTGCETYRIEHVEVPQFYYKAAAGGIPDQEVLPDGTIRVYRTKQIVGLGAKRETDDGGEPIRLRQQDEEGEVILRAYLPEHMIAHVMLCLQTEEYEVLYDQLLSRRTRDAYEDQGGGGRDAFVAYFKRHRRELLITIRRMHHGMSGRDVILENVGERVLRCRFRGYLARSFKFTQVDMAYESGGLKLVRVH